MGPTAHQISARRDRGQLSGHPLDSVAAVSLLFLCRQRRVLSPLHKVAQQNRIIKENKNTKWKASSSLSHHTDATPSLVIHTVRTARRYVPHLKRVAHRCTPIGYRQRANKLPIHRRKSLFVNCFQELFARIVCQNCFPELFSTIVFKNCSQQLFSNGLISLYVH